MRDESIDFNLNKINTFGIAIGGSLGSTKEEMNEFLDQLNSNQFKEIEKFFETMPKLSHTLKVKNPNTNVNNSIKLEGLSAFFA